MEEKQELPQGWVWTSLSKLTKRITDGTHQPPQFVSEGIPFVFVKHIVKGKISFENTRFISQEEYEQLNSRCPVEIGDVLYSAVGSYGVAVPVTTTVPFSFQRHIAHIKPLSPELMKFLVYVLNSNIGLDQAHRVARGVAQKTVTLGDLSKFSIPLPPLAEQRRIVAKLEELFSRLDAGVAAVRRTQTLLKRYRQSVLHAAVTGELTRAWREAHPVPAETGAALLTRIRAERRAKWEAAQVAKRGGQFPLGEDWRLKYVEPEAPDTSKLPELPESWSWAKIGHLADIKGGKRLPTGHNYADEETAYPYLRVTDFEQGTIRQSKLKYLSLETAALIKSYTISSADVYISIAGSIGVTGTIPESLSGANLTENAAKMCNIPFMPVKYIHYFFSSSLGSSQTAGNTASTTQPKLALFRIEQIAIPIPPLAEQVEIVAEVERRLTVLDALSQTLTDELKRAERLRQSLLHQACTGCLVPQEITDEPAAALLARLRETASLPKTRRTKELSIVPAKEKKLRRRKPVDITQIDFLFSNEQE